MLVTHSNQVNARRRAYTLVEMMLAIGIFLFLVSGIVSVSLFTARSFEALGNYSDMDRNSRYTMDMLSRDVRKSAGLIYFATNQITLSNIDGSTVAYQWDSISNKLTRTVGGVTRTMLTQCSSLSFDIFQRNPSGNFTFVSAAGNVSQAKLVSVGWECSRQIYGQKINTESVQTARIVIRN